jgi:hypothetical protein
MFMLTLQRRPNGRKAMTQSKSVGRNATNVSLNDEIAHLRDLDLKGLQARWKSMFRRDPPLHLPRHLLVAVLAYRLQADELGDLAPDTVRLLKQLATSSTTIEAMRRTSAFDRRRSELKPGTILTREWSGRNYRVMVLDDGFGWNAKTYDSLSKVAFAITGRDGTVPAFLVSETRPLSRRRHDCVSHQQSALRHLYPGLDRGWPRSGFQLTGCTI